MVIDVNRTRIMFVKTAELQDVEEIDNDSKQIYDEVSSQEKDGSKSDYQPWF